MHVLVQCPRLIVAIRQALRNPGDVNVVASAMSLAENLWHLTRQRYFVQYINASVRTVNKFYDDTMADILVYGIEFDTAQNMVISTRYWLVQMFLCGTLDTLHRRFPVEFALSLLPEPVAFHGIDVSAAMQLGRVVLALSPNPSPLTLIRTHGPFSGSTGAWHRQIRYLSALRSVSTDHTLWKQDLRTAERMKKWVFDNCNIILSSLNITRVDERTWMEALDCMAGEELVDWIPSRVSIGSEDGEIVMQLEYSDRTANGDARRGPTRVFNVRNPAKFGPQHLRDWVKGSGGPVVNVSPTSKASCASESSSPYF